ncbi:SDR family oxidoreductase [Propionibacterium freudenreichii]|uniref:SDR family oxidoreductase n=1 Tax=Propionibacterium freudenreichii TaxID=1744 RepID=UPI0005A5C751|nr:SDR family oxidoreductase [Propionibacterium freudenreichii]CEI31095.1 Short chain dehydrogenase [Propionibacterium freudenreichii]
MAERRTVLITGATRGIGRAVADELADEWHVLVGGRHPDQVRQVVQALPSAEPFIADLTDAGAMQAAVEQVGHLDAVVHSAGAVVMGPVSELSRQDWRDLYEINVVAVADLTAELLPRLREAHGQVVTINSGSGFHTGLGQTCYAATKHALVAFTDGLREEERGAVCVTSVHPGRVDTDMQVDIQRQLGAQYQPERYLQPADVAHAVGLALTMRPGANVDSVSIRPAL